MLSNAYFLAKFRFDTAENEPAKNLQNFAKFARMLIRVRELSDRAADAKPGHRAVGCTAYRGILIGLPRSKISKTSTSTQISAIILFLRKSRPHLALVCKLTERPKIDESNMLNHFL